jgi:Na+-translocating ferredoxin:NAD+ oxidoreductase RnfD subunit
MSDITIVQQTSPHLRRKDTLAGMMIDVLIALSPVLIYILIECCLMAASISSNATLDGAVAFQPIFEILLSVFVFCLTEFVFVLIKNRLPVDGNKHTFKEQFLHGVKAWDVNNFLVPCISGILFALVLPAKTTSPSGYIYFIVVIGALFGSIVGKLVFGGTGHNIFNPAIVGFIFTKECFGSFYRSYLPNYAGEVTTGGTFLGNVSSSSSYLLSSSAYSNYSLLDLFLGTGVGSMGTLGETCKLAILIGLAYLLVRHTVDWRVVVSYLGTFIVLMLFAGIIVQANVAGVECLPVHALSALERRRSLWRNLHDHRSGHDADYPSFAGDVWHDRGGGDCLHSSLRQWLQLCLRGRGFLHPHRQHVRAGSRLLQMEHQ